MVQEAAAESAAKYLASEVLKNTAGPAAGVVYSVLVVHNLGMQEITGILLGATNVWLGITYGILIEFKKRAEARLIEYEKFAKEKIDEDVKKGSSPPNSTNLARMYALKEQRECKRTNGPGVMVTPALKQ